MREALVTALSRDDGVRPYAKWRGAHWRLASLVELGVEPGHPGALAAAEQDLEWLANARRLRAIHRRVIDGRVRRCGSIEGLTLYACCRIGLADDARVRRLAESLVETQWPDGGWNCDVRPDVSHSSFHESWAPVLGLAAYGAADSAARGAEFLLRHGIVFSERTGEPAHPSFLKLRYPSYWHYDLLLGLVTLERSVGLGDPRVEDALDLLETKRRPDGTWRPEGRWWRPPGAKGGGIEAVDWGHAAAELLTERALGVLAAAGRQ